MASRGVGCSVHFIPLHLQPYWRENLGLRPEQLPVATAEFERVVSLPAFSSMTDAQVERVVETVGAVLA
jgi:dTDP-4-amino-4,6-dideoxygalactose transaminase